MSDGQENTPDAAGEPPVEPPAPNAAVPSAADLPAPELPAPDLSDAALSALDLPESDLDALLAPPADIAPVDPDDLLREAGAEAPAVPATRAARREVAVKATIPQHDPIPTDVLAPASEPSTGAYRVIAGLIFGGLVVLLVAAIVLVIVLVNGALAAASGLESLSTAARGLGVVPGS